jgi:hypothetical protein
MSQVTIMLDVVMLVRGSCTEIISCCRDTHISILKIQLSQQSEQAPGVPTAKSCYCSGLRSFCRNTFDLISAYRRKGNLLVTQKQKQASACLRHTFFSSKCQSSLPAALAQEHGIYNTSSLQQLLNQAKCDAQLRCRLVSTNQSRKASPGTNSQFDYTSLAMQCNSMRLILDADAESLTAPHVVPDSPVNKISPLLQSSSNKSRLLTSDWLRPST